MSQRCIAHTAERRTAMGTTYSRGRRDQWAAAGLCRGCGRKPDGGYKRCAGCRERGTKKSRDQRLKNRLDRRVVFSDVVRRVVVDLVRETDLPPESWDMSRLRAYGLILAQVDDLSAKVPFSRGHASQLRTVIFSIEDDAP